VKKLPKNDKIVKNLPKICSKKIIKNSPNLPKLLGVFLGEQQKNMGLFWLISKSALVGASETL